MDNNREEKKKEVEKGVPTLETEEKLKYPKSIFFIFSNEFCERFSYYGMRTILALYLQGSLGYSEDMSTVIYHVFVMLCYFTPLIGGIIADSWLGKYKTIFYVSIMYAIGNISLSVGAMPEKGVPHVTLSLLGLFLIASGTGGIKPCVSSFGGDQFVVPQQQRQLESFFSVFYFSINAGSVLSCFFTPMLREVKCLGQDSCYPLAFGVPALLMVLSIVFFVMGKRMYKIKKPVGKNVVVDVSKCIGHAIARKIRSSKEERRNHWLDYADDKYSIKQIQDTKILMKIIYLFAPTIIFWSLYEQQGSRWTFQASHMDGRIGSWYVLQPDQMQTVNAVMVLLFIPVFETVVYPVCFKLRIIRTSLQKISWGGFIGALSFVVAGIVQLYMQASYPVLPEAGEAQLRVYNSAPCRVEATTLDKTLVFPADDLWQDLHLPLHRASHSIPVNLKLSDCHQFPNVSSKLGYSFVVNNKKASSYLIYLDTANSQQQLVLEPLELNEYKELEKDETGNPKIKIVYNIKEEMKVILKKSDERHTYQLKESDHQTIWNDTTTTGKYKVSYKLKSSADKKELSPVNLEPGGIYVMMITNNLNSYDYKLLTITPPNNISMMWQLPQYFLITFAEILFSITGMEFSFTQSPNSMKSVTSSLWLFTDSIGNIIVLVVAGLRIFENQAYEFFLFAGLMVLGMVIFVILAVRYEYVYYDSEDDQAAPRRASLPSPATKS